MGLLGWLGQVKNALADGKQKSKMSAGELLALDDEALCHTLELRLAWEIRWERSRENYVGSYEGAKRAFFVVQQYDAEVNNGGLCQYFVNPSRLAAPYLAASLEAIGAPAHAALFSGFIAQNGIDPADLSAFAIRDLAEFSALNQRYPFDAYDKAFYALYSSAPLNSLLAAYARQHIGEFAVAR